MNLINICVDSIGIKEGSKDFKELIAEYNAIKPLPQGYVLKTTDEWCCAYVSVMFKRANIEGLVPECSVQRMIEKNQSIYEENGSLTPSVGDLICYNYDDKTQPNDGWADHIGVVRSVTGDTITCIEGNVSQAVKQTTVNVGSGTIRGFIKTSQFISVSDEEVSKDKFTSIVDYLKHYDIDSSFINRSKIAFYLNEKVDYTGSYNQNVWLLDILQNSDPIDIWVDRVISGDFKNEPDRIDLLKEGGCPYPYSIVKEKVNERYK